MSGYTNFLFEESSVKTNRAALLFAACILPCFFLCSCLTTLESLASSVADSGTHSGLKVTNEEAIAAMKDALTEGIACASRTLSAPDGYFGNAVLKILLPPEAKNLMDCVGKIPQGQKLIDDVVLRINRSAEDAAKDVVPIFVDAIKQMTVADGIAIIKGGNNAATNYLESKTRQSLMNLYRPKVAAALSKPLVMNISAEKSWDSLTGAYNRAGVIPNKAARFAGKKEPMPAIQVDLATYATGKALDGLYLKMGEEEAKIRANPFAYASAMIKKVFGAMKNGLL